MLDLNPKNIDVAPVGSAVVPMKEANIHDLTIDA
jgi:hypothetical protein